MKRAALAVSALCGAALTLTPLGIAWGQSVIGPDSQACRDATALAVTATADADTLGLRLAAQVKALDDTRALLAVAVDSAKPYFEGEVRRLEALVAAVRADLGAATAKVQLAVSSRDTACAPQTTTPPVTPPPTTTVPPTTTPAPSVDELNCGDFPLPDGRGPQDVLNADPADPNRLDSDGDGVACELDEEARTDTAGDFDQVGRAPVGGVETGGR